MSHQEHDAPRCPAVFPSLSNLLDAAQGGGTLLSNPNSRPFRALQGTSNTAKSKAGLENLEKSFKSRKRSNSGR